jgi:hypothetical protein
LTVYRLINGYLHVRFPGGFAQIPPGYDEPTIPDEFIFAPEWNRERVNLWWAKYRELS